MDEQISYQEISQLNELQKKYNISAEGWTSEHPSRILLPNGSKRAVTLPHSRDQFSFASSNFTININQSKVYQ